MNKYDAVQRATSAACLPTNTVLSLRMGPASTVPLEFINYETDYGPDGTGELVCHVRGEADDLDAAAVALTNSGIRNLQVLAVAANAAILTPHLQVAYEARAGGRFLASRVVGSHPQGARRMIDMDRSMDFIRALEDHPKEMRLLRAIENYGESLRWSDPASSIHSALHLWMAVESLTHVVAARLLRDSGLADVQDLAPMLDVKRRAGLSHFDNRDVYGAIRRLEIFAGDDATHKALRTASDGVEHGYSSFGDARNLIAGIFVDAAAAVRRSILTESGLPVPDVEALMSGIYARPLPLWRPRVTAVGRFAGDTEFDFDRPVHIQVNATVGVEGIAPDTHITAARIETEVRTLGGLSHVLDHVHLASPGTATIDPA